MHHLSHSRASLLATAVLAAALSGCGGGDDASDVPAPTTSTSASAATTPGGTTPATGAPGSGGETSGDKPASGGGTNPEVDLPDPPAAGSNTKLPLPTDADSILVRSKKGTSPKWRVAGQLKTAAGSDTFCVAVARLGANQPDPICQPTTLLVLSLVGNDSKGPVSATVDPIARTARTAPEDLLVSGVVPDTVKRVVVQYGSRTETAELSGGTSNIAIDRRLAAGLAGSAGKKLPSRVKVRVFGASMPSSNGNPPTAALPKPGSKGDTVTLVLQ